MKNTILSAGLTSALLVVGALSATSAHAVDLAGSNVSVGVGAGTTGLGLDAAMRFHDNFSVIAGYHGGLSWDGDQETDEAVYEGDVDLQAGSLKLAYHPFGGSFYLSAGAMFPDMEANVTGTPRDGQSYEYNGNVYTAADVGSLNGTLVIADGVQPYAGLGWRSSHKSGFGFFSEFGVMTTDVSVSLSSSENHEADNAQFREDLRKEEQRLEDDADSISVYPVAMIGVSYTF